MSKPQRPCPNTVRVTTRDERAAIVSYARQHGHRQAFEDFRIEASTLRRWVRRAAGETPE